MAEENHPHDDHVAVPASRRDRARQMASRAKNSVARRATAPAARARDAASATRRPLRNLVIFSMVGGLVATVGLPAYGAITLPSEEPQTLQQVAEQDAQSLVIASAADAGDTEEPVDLGRESYSATTAEEIEEKKAEEAAAEAAAERARLAAASASAEQESSQSSYSVDLSMVAPGSGAVRYPLAGGYTVGDGFLARGGSHMGVDLLAPAGTPIYAAAGGVVRMSQESLGGYGVAVVIDHVINGQSVTTTYGHMIYGSRQVVAGQTVAPGQVIGLVGTTGRSTANHLHFEVAIGGSNVDPWAWVQQNAG
ncbi:M23 family metallopeptidase [Microbacterium xanthum]|uniref:M23 family metallopeptidase n=1 Tax=Microbacterium xanthum TaxID=3079794 RepID=UPI002AD3741A|nr:M23 family metallopeptidase [Microbacterium sp. KSW-48]MDZ8171961.1 M23 family metallopeptidase [Microbacterium sp. KSW-48]